MHQETARPESLLAGFESVRPFAAAVVEAAPFVAVVTVGPAFAAEQHPLALLLEAAAVAAEASLAAAASAAALSCPALVVVVPLTSARYCTLVSMELPCKEYAPVFLQFRGGCS